MALLEVRGLTKEFGGLAALNNVDLTIEEGEIHGLIGPNGAGKTTLFNVVTGVLDPTEGRIELEGRSLVGMRPHRITRLGIARTFQNIRLFAAMTALENVLVGLDAHHKTGILEAIVRTPRSRREESEGSEEAFELLSRVGIRGLA
ncbi:MAG: ABC transporter ATP-binding protein, partial [Acidimicrobiia bacterium]